MTYSDDSCLSESSVMQCVNRYKILEYMPHGELSISVKQLSLAVKNEDHE